VLEREIITQIKYLVSDGNYKYILCGLLLGTVFIDISSVPIGYIEIMRMYPLDFKEFALTNGIGSGAISMLEQSFTQGALGKSGKSESIQVKLPNLSNWN